MRFNIFAAVVLAAGSVQLVSTAEEPAQSSTNTVSFYKQVRPIFQAHCQGCHQPAKDKGGYVMTEFERLLAPGDSGEKPIVPGKPAESLLVKQIIPNDGKAEMPKGEAPLAEHEISLISQWIQQGAHDDTPQNAKQRYDQDHPPIYSRAPIISSLDYSPDGTLIAVAGFHEVLLHKADGSGLAGRLVGLSERVQSLRFSPDGKWLAVAGGHPGRLGEIQIWDVEKRKLSVSSLIGYDTLYGVSWSPDGKTVSFGCPDKTVRAVEVATGKQVLQQGSHNDWVLDTVFSTDGSHIISVGRDMTAKLTEVATQRFVDNITSITPGALRGGIHSIARHPKRDEILVGGSDGVPQIFQVYRQAARKIGDNATLLRKLGEMEGRIFSVDYNSDGSMVAAGATLDAHGAVNIYSAQFDSTIPTNILKAYQKTSGEYTAEERAAIEKFITSDVKLMASAKFPNTAIYAVAFSPDNKQLAAAGGDGQIRLISVENGSIAKEFAAAPIAEQAPPVFTAEISKPSAAKSEKKESLPEGAEIKELEVMPSQARIRSRNEHVQFIVMARLAGEEKVDVTRMVQYSLSNDIGQVSSNGRFTAIKEGAASLTISMGGKSATVSVETTGLKPAFDADFVRDVNPVLSKLGCNAGTCHGAKDGKNGFKLSLRGYDPLYDVRAFADDLASRRVNVASPDDSLLLLKATGAVPHEGGQRTEAGSEYYAIMRQWIADGAKLNLDASRVTGIEVFPKDPVVQDLGAKQQMRIVARYSDGTARDVTSEAFIESGNTDVVSANADGLVTSLRRGEAPVLARFEGAYAATTVTVMGDRSGFVWKDQPANNHIDELVAAKWKRMKILPSDVCSDAEFIRRAYLDLAGLPPSADEVKKFVSDATETRTKREALVDRLIGSPEFVDHWANKWADLLQVNRKFLGEDGARLFRDWIRKEVESNTPYNVFAQKILTATGSNRENPAASYFKILREPTELMENTTHLFLATRFNCNKCHDHPFERWTQDQYYQMAAFFSRVNLKKDDASGDKRIGGTAVEDAKPLYEIVSEIDSGEVKHDRTGKVTPPDFPYAAKFDLQSTNVTRREKLAAWMTSADNRYFATAYVNRLWGYLMGAGLIEPLDDIRAGNPPSNPELLEHLTREFIEKGFDTRHILRLICQSRTYQLSVATHKWNADDKINYSHATARRLPAEVLLDSVYKVTGAEPRFPGLKPGVRAAQLPDSGVDLPSGFLANLGRPPRESSCECERSNDMKLGSVMTLLSGPAVSSAVNDPANGIAKLVSSESDDRKVIDELFFRILNRGPSDAETKSALRSMASLEAEHRRLINELGKSEAAWGVTKVGLEKARLEAIQKAEKALAHYLTERAPKVAAEQRSKQEKIAAAEIAVRDFEPSFVLKLMDWERQLPSEQFSTLWQAVDPKEVRGTGSARLTKLADGSVRSSGSGGELPDYVVTSETTLTNITGFKLEALTDADLPAFGPGLKDGNFFVSEVVVEVAPKSEPAKFSRVKIVDGRADFIASGHDLKHTYDGKVEQGLDQGWTVSGSASEPHWAAYKFENPVGQSGGSIVRVTIQHRYQAPYEIGRFRLWITTSENPTGEGLPSDIASILNTPVALRTEQQAAKLAAHYRPLDAEMRKLDYGLVLSKKPLPEDTKLKELELNLARASRPVPTDAALVQLRQDVELSTRQLVNRRLTAAQDLAWALINTPAFLFNR